MRELYDLKEMLCKELKEYGTKGELSAGALDTIDKLAHAAKNVEKLIEAYEDEGYSGYYPYRSYRDGGYRGRSYAKRDGMGRYSRADGFADELRELMKDAPDDEVKAKIRKLVEHVEQM